MNNGWMVRFALDILRRLFGVAVYGWMLLAPIQHWPPFR
jgi:hypothetical protein